MSSTYSLRWALVVSALAMGVSGNSNPMFGEITSPGYPDSYPNDSRASWAVGVPPGYRVRLQFRYFQLEPSRDCVYDRLKVSSGGKTLGVFCGNDNSVVGNPPRGRVLTSTGNTMDLEFQSDFSNEGQFLGFLIYYEAIDVDECSVREGAVPGCEHLCHNTLGSYSCSCRHGYQLQSDGKSCRVQCQEFFSQISGELTSPEYPAPYPMSGRQGPEAVLQADQLGAAETLFPNQVSSLRQEVVP
ncbi:mannan-binding lectin serine protease 1-like [Pristis pectinata]|uniref:mannan-binding lectin serine protease 1-like n=1 Tax=Pristis pectinata TaxID=685728 RepID=UPI00223D9CC6|nr:mannan-binding lectin serine protease 1-like [Pristis pectinata]